MPTAQPTVAVPWSAIVDHRTGSAVRTLIVGLTRECWTVEQLADAVGLVRSAAFRHVEKLMLLGYVSKPAKGRYVFRAIPVIPEVAR